jgi:hypothetical protein
MLVRRAVAVWLPLAAWMAVIFHFSLLTEIPGPAGSDISYLHLPAYFMLSALLLRLFVIEGVKRGFLLAIIASTSYGLIMEALQPLLQARMFSLQDIALNFAGSCLILILSSRRSEKAMRIMSRY